MYAPTIASRIAFVSFLWGLSYLLIDAALIAFPPPVVVVGRCALAAMILLPIAIHAKAFEVLRGRTPLLLATVLVQSTAPLLLLTYGQLIVSPGLAGIITGAQPLFVAVLAYGFARSERPRDTLAVIGLIVGFAGLIMVFGGDLTSVPSGLIGGALIAAAALCYAIGSIVIQRNFADAQPVGISAAATTVSAVVLAVPSALALPAAVPALAPVVALVVLGTLCTALSTTLFYSLITRAGPARATLSFYLAPAVAVVLSAAVGSQQLSWTIVAGLVAILVGSALAARRAPVRAIPHRP